MSGDRVHPLLALAICVAVTFAASAGGVLFSPGDWYAELAKPAWTPPPAVFPVAWTLLYAAMAVAAWLVWRAPGAGRGMALALFGIQLALNAAWTPVFFGLEAPALALLVILALVAAIAATIVAFARVRPLAAALLLPYLAWVGFASALNATIVALNP